MNRRFTRLTNAHSKKVENHIHFLNITFMWYNFARINQALRVTPAMAAGVSDRVWSIDEIIGLLDSENRLSPIPLVVRDAGLSKNSF